jgi:thymidine phosphorylase
MSEPLARSAGNALEVREAIAMLRGEPADAMLLEVTLALGAEVMVQGKLSRDEAAARASLANTLTDGRAAERFSRMVASLGGPTDFLEKSESQLARAPVVADVPAASAGTVLSIDTRAVGFAVVRLGGGRTAPDQAVDHAVGFDRLRPRGAAIQKGEPIARVHARSTEAAEAAAAALTAAFTIGEGQPEIPPLVEKIA